MAARFRPSSYARKLSTYERTPGLELLDAALGGTSCEAEGCNIFVWAHARVEGSSAAQPLGKARQGSSAFVIVALPPARRPNDNANSITLL